ERDQRCQTDEYERVEDTVPEDRRDGLLGADRGTEVAGEHSRSPVPVLAGYGSLEMELLAYLSEPLRRDVTTKDRPRSITRKYLRRTENDDRDEEDRQ